MHDEPSGYRLLIHTSQVVIEPVEHRLYQSGTLIRDIVRRIENHVALVASGCPQHREERILRPVEREAVVVTPVYHQDRYFQPGRKVSLVIARRRWKEEVSTVQKDGSLETILQQ